MTDLREEGANIKSFYNYATLTVMGIISRIRRLSILVNNFEIKSTIIQMIQVN